MASVTEVWLTQPALQLLLGHDSDVGLWVTGIREVPLASLLAW